MKLLARTLIESPESAIVISEDGQDIHLPSYSDLCLQAPTTIPSGQRYYVLVKNMHPTETIHVVPAAGIFPGPDCQLNMPPRGSDEFVLTVRPESSSCSVDNLTRFSSEIELNKLQEQIDSNGAKLKELDRDINETHTRITRLLNMNKQMMDDLVTHTNRIGVTQLYQKTNTSVKKGNLIRWRLKSMGETMPPVASLSADMRSVVLEPKGHYLIHISLGAEISGAKGFAEFQLLDQNNETMAACKLLPVNANNRESGNGTMQVGTNGTSEIKIKYTDGVSNTCTITKYSFFSITRIK